MTGKVRNQLKKNKEKIGEPSGNLECFHEMFKGVSVFCEDHDNRDGVIES